MRKMSHSANFFDTGNTTVFYQGVEAGVKQERERIVEMLNLEASEWLSHDGSCLCRYKGDEVLRLIAKIKEDDELR